MALQVHARLRRFREFLRSAGPAARCVCSLTVEAAAAFPLFLFALYLLILPMRMMRTSMQMQQVCEQTCEVLAEAAYMQQLAASAAADAKASEASGTAAGTGAADSSGTAAGRSSGAGGGASSASGEGAASLKTIGSANGGSAEKRSGEADALIKWLSTQGAATLIGTAAAAAIEDENVDNLISWRSGYMVDGEIIRLTLDYRYRLPFFGLGGLHQSVTASRRAWIGRSEGGISSGSGKDEEEEIVYVGRNSTRYHASPSCHYLSNKSMKPVSYASLESLRNSGGSRYKPCARCGKGGHPATVYIMPSGEVWHSDPDCSAISAYAHAVKKSEVEHLGPCSYCCH